MGIDAGICVVHSREMVSANDIRSTRTKLQESQAAFGARFGVDQSTIARWEENGPPQRGPAKLAVEQIIDELREAAR